ncbi:MAG: hypothetical protein B6I26_01900 [Desulfobacteraceae bacterium 4572_130]|nr:MAG: hypothetical protein B6I26_01900 [Desulfobacteraceae bacterium 4572_130]
MINKLKILGKYVSKKEKEEEKENLLGLNLSLKEANIIVLEFDLKDGICNFIESDTIEFEQKKNNKILYKKAGSNSRSPFATYSVFFNKKEMECKENIRKSFNKFIGTIENNTEMNSDLKPVLNFLKIDKNRDLLEEEIFEFLSAEKNNLFTIKINNLFIGDSPLFYPILDFYKNSNDRDKEYFSKHNKTSIGENIPCYICGKTSKKLYGFCSTFAFYSANEFAYIAGGFQQDKTWKNYPVCPICSNHLRLAKEKLNKNFDRYFYGNKYFLIPSPTLDKGDFYENLLDIEEDFKDLSLSKKNEEKQKIRGDLEDDIFETLSKQKDQITFTFFFYKVKNSEFKILQEAEDILPSRFQKIIKAKKNVEINNDFLDITTKILKGQKISKSFIYYQISERLAENHRIEKSDIQKYLKEKRQFDCLKAMIFLKFLYEMSLIETTKNKMEVIMQNKYEEYFQLHPDFYDANWKKAVFLTGVLAQNVMDIQYINLKSRPFRSRLNGLKLDVSAIKRLLPEAIEKLEQYKSNYYYDLEKNIFQLIEISEQKLKLQSVDEISFYFAMGMSLNKKFKNKEKEKGENDE